MLVRIIRETIRNTLGPGDLRIEQGLNFQHKRLCWEVFTLLRTAASTFVAFVSTGNSHALPAVQATGGRCASLTRWRSFYLFYGALIIYTPLVP